MLKNYFKIAWRNLTKNKVYSVINIAGFAAGMAVALLIALWIWDELSFNKHFKNHDRIAQVLLRGTAEGQVFVNTSMPVPLGEELARDYPGEFKTVTMVCEGNHTLIAGDERLSTFGSFVSPGTTDMLSLEMVAGSREGLKETSSILLNETTARALFGNKSAVGEIIKIDNRIPVKVTGVFRDFPANTEMADNRYLLPWDLALTEWKWIKDIKDSWDFHSFNVYVQLADNASFETAQKRIKDVYFNHHPELSANKPELFLFPMDRWHLYNKFDNGISVAGQMVFVKLFGLIGGFVLLLACINFMNLSTARSEKRAREVGIRKAVGSLRAQLVGQFFSESILVALLALVLALLLAQLFLPWFNKVALKDISIQWSSPMFWAFSVGFSVFAGIIAGSYPAAYLSSFQPVRVLKGSFRAGRAASTPRKILVILQFVVSVLLITGTITVNRQIQYAKDRPVGYERAGIISTQMTTPQIYEHYEALRNDLIASGAVVAVSQSQGPLTDIWSGTSDFTWPGKPEGNINSLAVVGARNDHGKVLNWQILDGRTFDGETNADSNRVILNESAVKIMGLKNPVGTTIRWGTKPLEVIGVAKDMIMRSPYDAVPPTVFYVLMEPGNFVNLRINPAMGTAEALKRISPIFKTHNPAAPFEYSFTSDDYAKKFIMEERISQLTGFVTLLAILISCLGLFGLASYMAEQRTKEIGIRKVMGASVLNLWGLLSREFMILVVISCLLASPLAWYVLHNWLQRFEYRINMSWWIFVSAGLGAMFLTLITVSTQTVKAALSNPVRSLRSE